MRQEHLFCAEVYHRLHSMIDQSKRVLFCLDGAAAKGAAMRQEIECATMPDLCFTFVGGDGELRLEAKIIENRRVKIGRDQRNAWCYGGTGKAFPHLWIGANECMDQFWMWSHDEFSQKIATHRTSKGPIRVFSCDAFTTSSCDMDTLVMQIISWAESNGFKLKVQK